MKKHLLSLIVALLSITITSAQMEIDGNILYGNEWIEPGKTYWKIKISEDNVYKVTVAELINAGMPLASTPLSQVQMHHFGNEHLIYTSTNGIGSADDYILFYGKKNRIELDRFGYEDQDSIFNTEYGLISDEAAYFLSISNTDVTTRLTYKEENLTGNVLPPLEYYMHEEVVSYNDTWYKPFENSSNVQLSSMKDAEGFGTLLTTSTTADLPISDFAEGTVDPTIHVRLSGNRNGHRFNLLVNNDIIASRTTATRTKPIIFDETINESFFTGSSIKVNVTSDLSESDKHRVGVIKLTYPRDYNMDDEKVYHLQIPPSSSLRYVEFSGYESGETVYLKDIDNSTLYQLQQTGDKYGAILPPSGSATNIALLKSELLGTSPSIEEKVYVDFTAQDHDYIILTSADFLDDGNGNNYVQEYADFRASELGGNYNPIIVDIDQLYDQFGYGVDRHFLSIRNFAHFVKENWTSAEYLFIIGHSLEYQLYRKQEDQIENEGLFYVPTFGKPGSDLLLVTPQGGYIPILAYGRLAARNTDELKGYLDKVIAFEEAKNEPQTVDKLWHKNLIHLSGGTTDIQNQIANHLSVMEDTITNSLYGAEVNTFYKKSSSSVQIALSDQIFDRIEKGSSIITFFGHSSVGTFDFSLDDVRNYENQGKYPILFSLGCYSGNIHTNAALSVSKNFVLTPEKGSVAFIASTGAAYIDQQYFFAREFYDKVGGELYGKPIGKVNQEVIQNTSNFSSFRNQIFIQQLAIHGDPALALLEYESPDLVLNESTAKVEPAFVDTYEDSFEFCVDVANLGIASKGTVELNFQHLNPSGEIETDSTITINIPQYSTNHCIDIPIKSRELFGENTLLVTVDPNNAIPESPAPDAELNNELTLNGQKGFKFFVLSNSANPVYPPRFGIVGENKVELMASTYNAFEEPQLFHIEIDTTALFNSPVLQKFDIDQGQGTFSQTVDLLNRPETVYYWRVSQDSTQNQQGAVWNESSFVHVPGSEGGWNQSHYFQYLENEFDGLRIDNETRQFTFVDNIREFRIVNSPTTDPGTFFERNAIKFDGWQQNIKTGISVIVIDTVKGAMWKNFHGTGGLYGSVNNNMSSTGRTFYFEYPADTEQSKSDLVNLLTNIVPDNYTVVVQFHVPYNKNLDPYPVEEWLSEMEETGSIFNTLKSEGALDLETFASTGPRPYIFAFIKGDNDKVYIEQIAPDEETGLNATFQVQIVGFKGSFYTEPIGPATKYLELNWESFHQSNPENDSTYVNIIGVKTSGEQVMLDETNLEKKIDLSFINPDIYPYIIVQPVAVDIPDRTAPEFTKVRITYEGEPDIALGIDGEIKQLLEEGEELSFDLELLNTRNVTMDAFKLHYSLVDNENKVINYESDINPIGPKEKRTERISISTKALNDQYTLNIVVNPHENPTETLYQNNFGLTVFEVKPDKTPPVMDVTFDGINILDNDIVSANPLISVTVQDDNEFLPINDTSSFTLLLKYPDGQTVQVNQDDPNVMFYPANEQGDKQARLEYNPNLTQDGTYTLTVETSDASGNVSGGSDYSISFRVFNEEMISDVFNYPNPFSTSTQFIFTLTGDEEPGNMMIRIMTVSGKVVREITMAELGNVHIGLNKTDYKWDGTDEYGDKLANGVYLYQVITRKSSGESYDRFSDMTQNNTGYLFKDGFGKMVIMR